jgi:circadian clock protein KaiC
VILLDFRVIDQIATRRLRIVKYRGSTHGTNEYPFLIDEQGISVIPITSLKLDHKVSSQLISTGLPQIDNLFSRKGIYKASSILLTGSAGTAKTIMASAFAQAACKRKEQTIYFSFEESKDQLIRNMRSVGINLEPYVRSKFLHINSSRPSLSGLERHLLVVHKLIEEHNPRTVIVDPISSLLSIGSLNEVRDILIRIIDLLKQKEINAFFTSLTQAGGMAKKDLAVDAVSSLADIWMDVSNHNDNNDKGRHLRIIKVRGMGHDPQTHQFIINNKGIQLGKPIM